MKGNSQRIYTRFLGKYGGLSLYDIYFEKIYSIDYEEIIFVKGYWYALIFNPDQTDVTSTDHEYFCIHDDLFDRILETEQNSDILLKVIHKEPSFYQSMKIVQIQDPSLEVGHKWLHLVIRSRGNGRRPLWLFPETDWKFQADCCESITKGNWSTKAYY